MPVHKNMNANYVISMQSQEADDGTWQTACVVSGLVDQAQAYAAESYLQSLLCGPLLGGLSQGDTLVVGSGDVDQCIPVPAAEAQEEDAIGIHLGLYSPEHDFKPAVSALPHVSPPGASYCTKSQTYSSGLEMNGQQIEQEIQAKGLTAPRVTLSDVRDNITSTEIVKHVSPSGQVLRWAVLTTVNGFSVAGKPSCSASPENDDAEIGERLAITSAENELWPLMGYELRSKLTGA